MRALCVEHFFKIKKIIRIDTYIYTVCVTFFKIKKVATQNFAIFLEKSFFPDFFAEWRKVDFFEDANKTKFFNFNSINFKPSG